MSAQEWEPGDPLPGFRRMAAHQGFLFNFRDQIETENCVCPDRARWPEPLGRELPSEEWFINYFKTQLGIEDNG